jgi:hypothetical protein
MSGHQDFTPDQLDRIESAVNSALAITDYSRAISTLVKGFLRTQDLMNKRTGPITSVNSSSSIVSSNCLPNSATRSIATAWSLAKCTQDQSPMKMIV